MERLQQSSNSYIKSLSRRDQGEGKEKHLPVGHFANVLIAHGDDFEPDSEFGLCLTALGRANERIARMQETYVANATSTWIEGTDRTLAQMKEYQKSKQKLESRRLALDTAQVKLQKSKREDFRAEEELRSQKAKYEESSEDVYRRMFDIKEAEADSISDLTAFLEAELTYYDRCREVLLQIKRDWPAYVFDRLRNDPRILTDLHPVLHNQVSQTAQALARRATLSPDAALALALTQLAPLQNASVVSWKNHLSILPPKSAPVYHPARTRHAASCPVSTFQVDLFLAAHSPALKAQHLSETAPAHHPICVH